MIFFGKLLEQILISLPTETPYAPEAREMLRLLRAKAPDSEIEAPFVRIQDEAAKLGVVVPLIPATEAYVTSICFLGAKSLSHVLSCIERCKERLLSIGPKSDPARRQIIASVMEYWKEKPGVGGNIVDKLLNYTILTPLSVVQWALVDNLERGMILTHSHIYEIVSSTVGKVTNRVRQIVRARNQRGLPADQVAMLDETLTKEREQMAELFTVVEDALRGIAEGSADAMAESRNADEPGEALLRGWGRRWLRVFRRKLAVEEAWVTESLADPVLPEEEMADEEEVEKNGTVDDHGNDDGFGNGVEVNMEVDEVL